MCREVSRQLAGVATIHPARAGLHLIAWLADGIGDRAAAAGIVTEPLSAHAVEPYGRGGLLLGYATVPEEAMPAAVGRLAAALSGLRPRPRGPRRAPARPGRA